MARTGWFQKDKPNRTRPTLLGAPATPVVSEASKLAAKLRPHELIAMLTHHYQKSRARSRPRVQVTLAVQNPAGKQAVVIAC